MRKHLAALLCACALPLGCSLLQTVAASGFQKPSLSFKDAKLAEASLEGATVNLVVNVDNPNDQGISLAETDYSLQIEGKPFVGGKPPAGLQIAPHGNSDVVLPVTFKFKDVASSLSDLLGKHSVDYVASGHIGVKTPIGTVALPLEKQGKLDLPRPPEVSIGSPKLKDLSLGAATLELPLTLKNPNGFAMPLGAVAGTLSVEGAEVGSVKAQDVGKLPASGVQTVSLPVRLRFSDAWSAIKALQQGAAKIGVKGELRSGESALPFAIEKQVDLTKDGQTGSAGD